MRLVTSDYESGDEAEIGPTNSIVDEAVTLTNVVKALFYPRIPVPRNDAVYGTTALNLARETMLLWEEMNFAQVISFCKSFLLICLRYLSRTCWTTRFSGFI